MINTTDEKVEITCAVKEPLNEISPVRSLVTVSFPNRNCPLTYYNDRFDLHPGDRVFVSGKFAGIRGTVVSVTTKFKIRLSDYEKVIASPHITFRGTYEQIAGKFVAFGEDALSADAFRTWILPPRESEQNQDQDPDDDVILGEGYSLALDSIDTSADVRSAIPERAREYCDEDRVLFLNVTGGIGTAFVSGTNTYEINFKLLDSPEHGREVYDLYCDCPYPGLCKHALAALYTLRDILEEIPEEKTDTGAVPNFTCISGELFWKEIRKNLKRITVV